MTTTLRDGLRRHPQDLQLLNNLAWLLATCEDQGVRRPKEAVEAAERVVELKPASAALFGTLGVALLRPGEFEESEKRLREALALHKTEQAIANDVLFLAMAHWELGKKDEALIRR